MSFCIQHFRICLEIELFLLKKKIALIRNKKLDACRSKEHFGVMYIKVYKI